MILNFQIGGYVDSTLNGPTLSPVTQKPYVLYGMPFGSLIFHGL